MKIFQGFSFRGPLLRSLGLTIGLVALTSCGPREAEKKAKEEAARVAAEEAAELKLQYNMMRLMPYIDPHMDQYLSLPNKPKQGQAYLRGRLVPVSVKTKLVHELYLDLPDDLRAINPDEIRTILLLDCTKESVGMYSGGGGEALAETCKLKIVDTTIPEIVGATSFYGGPPPARIEKYGEGDMKVKSKSIIEYLRSLPRK